MDTTLAWLLLALLAGATIISVVLVLGWLVVQVFRIAQQVENDWDNT